ncbi:ATP-binding cassette domain-containing protein [candidate division WOR-3 bacterium]|jgi:phospholipid/cholesterol/gamma-HCH transport system ATP-binding protein|nr:ATP-binding cassette domain-containing protein [candidate division WOR-3 bacterium]
MIEIIDVHKSFGNNHVLKGLDLTIRQGETVGVVGESGCGKTVLLKHILGLLKPDEGKILVDGMDINDNASHLFDVRKRFGMVFQSSALFDSLEVMENVIIGLKEHYPELGLKKMEEIGSEKLELVELSSETYSLKPQELSGGMKKRVAIARALSMDPEYLIYDEPTTGLDPIIADKMNNLMLHLKEKLNKTTVIVTHDLHSAFKVADRIAMLAEGKIVFEGSPEKAMKTDNVFMKRFIQSSSLISVE